MPEQTAVGKGNPGGLLCHMDLSLMMMGLVSRLSLANHSDSEWCVHIAQPRWVPVRRILEGGRTSDLLAFPEFFWLVVAC